MIGQFPIPKAPDVCFGNDTTNFNNIGFQVVRFANSLGLHNMVRRVREPD